MTWDHIWFIASWVVLAFQLVVIYFDYNSSEAGYKTGKAVETIPLSIWFQQHMGKWWWAGTVVAQMSVFTPFCYFWPDDIRYGFVGMMLAFQTYYYFAIIRHNYSIAH